MASCSVMSPNGLITRVTCSDIVENFDNVVSICMGATAVDNEDFIKLIKKYPIIAVNGCGSGCVDSILEKRGINIEESINVLKILNEDKLTPTRVSRMDDEAEKSVDAVNKRIIRIVDNF
ncbi:MAG TPA: putative zinc-binding protein [Methanobacterium sp.]